MEEKDAEMQIEGGTDTLSETVSLTLEGISQVRRYGYRDKVQGSRGGTLWNEQVVGMR